MANCWSLPGWVSASPFWISGVPSKGVIFQIGFRPWLATKNGSMPHPQEMGNFRSQSEIWDLSHVKNGIYMDLPSVGDYTITSLYGKSIIFRAHRTVVHQNGLAGPTSPRRSMRPPWCTWTSSCWACCTPALRWMRTPCTPRTWRGCRRWCEPLDGIVASG